MSKLPEQFAALEPYIDAWVLDDSASRANKRRNTPYDEIKAFYDATLKLAPEALEILQHRRLGELSDQEECLLKLLLALAEVGPAVEWYQSANVIDGFPAHRFELVEQIPDCAEQE